MLKQLFALLITFGCFGCAATILPQNAKHTATVTTRQVLTAIETIQDGESAAFKAKQVTSEQHTKNVADIKQALQIVIDVAKLLKTWQPGQPLPTQFVALLESVDVLLLDMPFMKNEVAKAEQQILALAGSN